MISFSFGKSLAAASGLTYFVYSGNATFDSPSTGSG